VDEVFLVLNYGDEEAPDYLTKYSNVWWVISDNSQGDAMKFSMAHIPNQVYLGCDDDIIYPSGYAEYMVAGIKKWEGLVSLHGRDYPRPITSFKNWIMNHRCLGNIEYDWWQVDMIGSGCCAFDTNKLKVSLEYFNTKNMADLWLSKLATEQNIPMIVLAHAKDYLTYIPQINTIWRSTRDYSEHTKILQSFIK
jgi:hypothetical protein